MSHHPKAAALAWRSARDGQAPAPEQCTRRSSSAGWGRGWARPGTQEGAVAVGGRGRRSQLGGAPAIVLDAVFMATSCLKRT